MRCHIKHCMSKVLNRQVLCTKHLHLFRDLSIKGIGGYEAIKYMSTQESQNNSSATAFLNKAIEHLNDRAITYDKPNGERSMAKTVAAFNVLTGHQLTEEQGWKFMALLKLARSEQGEYKADSFEDGCAYIALAGEAASQAV